MKKNQDYLKEYIRIAYYYYKTGITQQEIANKLGISRQRVNRILSECVSLGIVEIKVNGYEGNNFGLESELEKKFNLNAVRIADNNSTNINTNLGIAASKYLFNVLKDGDIIAFGRGKAMLAVAENMMKINKKDIKATQLVGSKSDEFNTGVDNVVHLFAQKTEAKPILLYSPVITKSKELRQIIMNELYFTQAYDVLKKSTIAIAGIGDMTNKELTEEKLQDDGWLYVKEHSVGEICTFFYDINGNRVFSSLDERMIAILEEDFRKISIRIGVAGSNGKFKAILGALKGGYINSLVTDFDTAELLKKC